MPRTVSRVQILKTGTWTGSQGATKFTVDDLDNVVGVFNTLSPVKGLRPHLKLGHTEAQKFFGQRSGFPSLGSVEGVWREGEYLYADFSNVPDQLVDLISKGRYKQVSVELYPKYEFDGKSYTNVLVGVALLGAELPAVKGLADLADALYQEYEDKQPVTTVEFSMPAPTDPAPAPQPPAIPAEFAERMKVLEQENKALAALFADEAAKSRRIAMTSAVDAAIAAGKFLPKQRDSALTLAEAIIASPQVVKYGEKEVDVQGAFVALFAELPVAVKLGEGSPAPKPNDGARAADIVDARIKELRTKDASKTHAVAFSEVLAALEPELKQRYAQNT